MRRKSVLGLALCLAFSCLWAALSPVAGQAPRARRSAAAKRTEAPPPLRPGDIDLAKSRVYVFVDKTGLGHEHAVEGKIKSGSIQLGTAAGAGSVEFDMTSFSADGDEARKYIGLKGSTSASTRQQVNKNMLGPDVLDVRRHPTATFTIDSAAQKKTKQGQPVFELKGKFTLKGKTRALTVYAQPSPQGAQLRLTGDFTILQTDFGITPYSTALGAVGVADPLKIWGDLWIAGDETKTR